MVKGPLFMAKILIVDDEPGIQIMITTLLKRAGHESVTAADGLQALEFVKTNTFDLIITDLRMPHMDGLNLIRELTTLGSTIPVILVTGYASAESAKEAAKLGVSGYLAKPFFMREMLAIVEGTLATGKEG